MTSMTLFDGRLARLEPYPHPPLSDNIKAYERGMLGLLLTAVEQLTEASGQHLLNKGLKFYLMRVVMLKANKLTNCISSTM